MSSMFLASVATAAARRRNTPTPSAIAQACIDGVDSRIAGKTVAENGLLYIGYHIDPDLPFVRDPDVWCADVINLSSAVAYGSNWWKGVLVAPNIIIGAWHTGRLIPSWADCVEADGTRVRRTIAAHERIGTTDLEICITDSEYPSTCKIAKVFSAADWATLAADISSGNFQIPTMGTDQEGRAMVRDRIHNPTYADYEIPSTFQRAQFYLPLVPGASSTGSFFIYEDELVLDCTWFSGGTGAGPSVHYYRSEINAAISNLGSIHRLYEVGE